MVKLTLFIKRQHLLERETDCTLACYRLHQVIWIDDTCSKAAEFPRKPLLESVLAETGASAKSVWLITTDAPLQVFRVRSLVLGLEGQTIAPVPHKIAHSCIFNEAWGQMVWNDIIQCLAVLRQRKSSASTTMLLFFMRRREDAARVPPHRPPSHLLHFTLQLFKLILAKEMSWAHSPHEDELEGNS